MGQNRGGLIIGVVQSSQGRAVQVSACSNDGRYALRTVFEKLKPQTAHDLRDGGGDTSFCVSPVESERLFEGLAAAFSGMTCCNFFGRATDLRLVVDYRAPAYV